MTALVDDTRARLALIASPEALTATGLEIEDLTDPDARSVAIRADHAELDEALADGRDHVTVAGEPMNIRLLLAMHEVVGKQPPTTTRPRSTRPPGGSWTPATTATRSCTCSPVRWPARSTPP